MKKIIKTGAEAEVYLTQFLGYNVVVKKRLRKSYRIPEVDNIIRVTRTKREIKIIHLAKSIGINTPAIIFSDVDNGIIVMEYVKGDTLKKILEEKTKDKIIDVIEKIGEIVGRLHKENIVHGDLTPANIIIDEKTGELFLIDFGLSEITNDYRLKAVDIHVFKESLKTLTDDYEDLMKEFVRGYLKVYQEGTVVLKIEAEIERLGRYVRG